ncbi:Cyclolysin [Cognatishimia activa]|uniref:Cyclolysin n=1 Tax=Cognatishimia activa TaxID=1715691 RepID=A0A0P1ITZ8_9RHOB|nr:calcium-binding protein [Cognatishimia activa]CUK24530.1 Cyclolysin [Cognatishimia activa]
MQLNHTHFISSRDERLDNNISGLEIVDLPSGKYVVTTSGAGGGIRSYRIDPSDGRLYDVDQEYFASALSLTDISGLSVMEVDGQTYAIAGSSDGSLVAYSLAPDGTLSDATPISGIESETTDLSALASFDLNGSTALYIADAGTSQLNAYISESGTPFAVVNAGIPIVGDAQLQTVEVNGQPYVLLLDQSSRGIQSLRIDTNSGALTPVDSLGSAQGVGIQSPKALQTTAAFGETWVFAGGADSSSITVMRLTESGVLEPSDHIVDTLQTRFGTLQDIAVAQSGDRVFIVAGGGDDGLSLFTLLPNGQLLHLQSIAQEEGLGLTDLREINATLNDDQIDVFATGEDGGITQFTLELADIGAQLVASEFAADTLTGGTGNDVLISQGADTRMTGGAGQDWFVVGYGAQDTIITDFDPASDYLDLSDFPMLRSPTQLSVETIGGGIRLTYRDATITVFSHNGAGLTLDDLFGPSFWWPDRFAITLPDGLYLEGSNEGDSMIGASRADTLHGADGNDTLSGLQGADHIRGEADSDLIFGNNGNDHLDGGGGDDTAWGGEGDDTVIGGDGNDTLGGSFGNDVLMGDAGADEMWADQGQDSLHGGAGNDTVGGGSEDDVLNGDAGNDQAWGGGGDDIVHGGLGHDTLGGREGNDTLSGGAGNDEMWANAGDDLLWGGTGGDVLGGSDGDDTLHGEAGDDDLRAGNDNDSLLGGDGNDTMDGSSGNDRAFGGDDNDLIYGGFGDDYLEGNDGNDQVWGGTGNDRVFGGEGDDTLGGHEGDDTLEGEGGHDQIWANAGDDIVRGGNGNDLIGGSQGNDSLYGEAGNDTLLGSNGQDQIWAGTGSDQITGGANADTFHFYVDEDSARITDFEDYDRIHIHETGLSYAQIDISQSGDDVFIAFQGTEITLENMSLSDIGAEHFVFG